MFCAAGHGWVFSNVTRNHRAAHRRIWSVLLVLLPLVLLAAMALRQNGPTEAAAVLLSGPK